MQLRLGRQNPVWMLLGYCSAEGLLVVVWKALLLGDCLISLIMRRD